MTDKAELIRKVLSNTVTELMSAGCHPAEIVEAMTKEIETLRQQMRNVDS